MSPVDMALSQIARRRAAWQMFAFCANARKKFPRERGAGGRMRVLGIDPGLQCMGWGVIEQDGSRLRHVANGTCRTGAGDLSERLLSLFDQLSEVLRLHAPAQQDDVRRLAARHGLQPTRWFVEMSRPLDDLPPAPPSDGVRLLDWSEGRSGEVHRVLDRAFADHWGHAYRTAEMWAEQTSASSFRPAWSVLAVDETTDAVVGAAFSCAYVQDWTVEGRTEGYTDELGVLRSHRGRGVARTLLVASMRRFAAAGMDAAALGVDTENPSGALGLYRWPGYVETATTCSADGRRPRPTAWMRDSGVGSARRPRYCASRAGKRSTWSLNRSSPGPGTGSVRGMAFICCAVAGRTRRS